MTTLDGLSQNTISKVKSRCENENHQIGVYPLIEVPTGGLQRGLGFVSAPLNSSEVWALKRELKGLLDDLIGLSEQVDQFLGPNTCISEKMQSILGILFTPEKRQMIRIADMRIWDREHQNRSQNGEEKMPIQCPP